MANSRTSVKPQPFFWPVWVAIALSVGLHVYLGLEFAGMRSIHPAKLQLLTWIHTVVALVQIFTALVLLPRLMPKSVPTFHYFCIRWSLMASVGVYGAALMTYGADFNTALAFFLSGVVGVVLIPPSAKARRRYEQRP